MAFISCSDNDQTSTSDNGDGNGNEEGSPRRKESGGSVTALACAVVIDTRRGNVVEKVWATAPVYFPYVPGFLSFREGPAVLAAIGELTEHPGVLVFDGCGIAHPRGLGLASHMSLLTGVPSIGCAKSLLCGTCEEPGPGKGSWGKIVYRDTVVGTCLRTRDNVRPVYVSPGNGFDIDGARKIVDRLAPRYRLPEPTRLAHNFVTEKKKYLNYPGSQPVR